MALDLYFTAIGRASALVTLELLPYSYTHPLPISALVNSSTQVSSWQNHLFNTGSAKTYHYLVLCHKMFRDSNSQQYISKSHTILCYTINISKCSYFHSPPRT